ncbi:MAG TPA: hypothetical protein VFW42_02765 [Fluviicoccus sp.]|nr:hypothetical protein [Fluviicoccus sp.]
MTVRLPLLGMLCISLALPALVGLITADDSVRHSSPGRLLNTTVSAGPLVVPTEAPKIQLRRKPVDSASDHQILALIRQLSAAGDEESLFRLRSLLADRESPQGLRLAGLLLAEPDPALRRTGIDLLAGQSLLEPEVHRRVITLLDQEHDPALLQHLLTSLDAPIGLYGRDTEMSARLHKLLEHANNEVRAQALLQMLQWDDYPTLEGYLYSTLNDPSPEVRLSAATVASLIDTRSTTLKNALLTLRDNPRESRDMHASVLAALHNMDTSEADPSDNLPNL